MIPWQRNSNLSQEKSTHFHTHQVRDFGDGLNLGGSGAKTLVRCTLCQSLLRTAMCRLDLSYCWFLFFSFSAFDSISLYWRLFLGGFIILYTLLDRQVSVSCHLSTHTS